MVSSIVKVSLCLFCAFLAFSAPPSSPVIDKLLSDDAALTELLHCFLELGPCTPVYEEYRVKFRQNLQSGCEGCNDDTKALLYKVGKYLMDKRPDDFKAIQVKFDPEKQYYGLYMEHLNAYIM